MRYMLLALALVGCAGGADSPHNPDAGPTGDGATCGIGLAWDPIDPEASAVLPVRVYTALSNPGGAVTFNWTVTFMGNPVPFSEAKPDFEEISFIAAQAGPYVVDLTITGGSSSCTHDNKTINVAQPGAIPDLFRLRTVPSSTLAPPQETVIQVKGGADAERTIALDSGISAAGTVRNSSNNAAVVAYLKFMPVAMPTAFSEQFSSSTGNYSLRLLPINHDVLVIPTSTALAPRLVPWSPTAQMLTVGPGTVVSGIVRGPGGAGIAGAKVILSAGNVPSTVGTTVADGSFSVRTEFPDNATMITVKVTPPATSGLPRLEATGALTLTSQVQINYASGLTTCNLANVPVRRGGNGQANARVSVVGTLAGTTGTVIAGVTVNAANHVRVSAVADGSGQLPSMLVPRGALTAVTELSMTDHAASTLDTTASCTVAQIDAPAMTNISGTTKNITMTTLGDIRIEAEPIDELALAGVLPIQITSNATTGAFSLPLAGGGRYNVRFTDPNARAAPLVARDVAPGGVPTNAVLPKALAIYGGVEVVNNMNAVVGASVQLLCVACSGIDVTRPIAETATDSQSRYRIAVPDPGTM